MINQESVEKIRKNVRQYIEGRDQMDAAIDEIKNVLNMPRESVGHLIELVSHPLEDDDSETLSNIRLFVEVVRPLLGDV